MLSTRQIFRPEIAALRALAVTSVILFHLKVEGFQGGFVGVDVFFVISGYLITRNILADLQANEFSLAQFYVRRTRRIYPALIATVVATYIAGALWCSPLMFLDLAKECTHALLSISNIQYWRELSRYFAPNSDELALLHCWSLSLEEQFYLVWPVFVVLAHKVNRTRQAIVIATITSFLASIVVARSDPSATFFLMPFRIFEFGIGAGVLFVDELRLGGLARQIASAVGVLSVVASALILKSDIPKSGSCHAGTQPGRGGDNPGGEQDFRCQAGYSSGSNRGGDNLLFALSLSLAHYLLRSLHLWRRCQRLVGGLADAGHDVRGCNRDVPLC